MNGNSYVGPDGKCRCRWSGAAPAFLDYHDSEWGYPVVPRQHLWHRFEVVI